MGGGGGSYDHAACTQRARRMRATCVPHARRTHAAYICMPAHICMPHTRRMHAVCMPYACLRPEGGAALGRHGIGVAAPLECGLELRRHVGVAVAAAGQVGEVQAQQEHVQQQRQPQQQEAARRRLQHHRARAAPLRREGAEQP